MINWTESSSVLNTTLYFRVTQGFQWDPNFDTILQKQYSKENFLKLDLPYYDENNIYKKNN